MRSYRKKVEKDEDYIKTVVTLGSAIEDLVKQNNVVDIYEEYFTGITTDHSAEVPSVKTVTVFKDPSSVPRSASYVNWHPDASVPKVAISYSILQVSKRGVGKLHSRCFEQTGAARGDAGHAARHFCILKTAGTDFRFTRHPVCSLTAVPTAASINAAEQLCVGRQQPQHT